MRFTVIGAGNGGQALAAYLAIQGHRVCLYNRSADRIRHTLTTHAIELTGRISGIGILADVTDDIGRAVTGADIIMIATTANAHADIAAAMAPYLSPGQTILLNPGRTGGVWTFRKALDDISCTSPVFLAEAQTLVYACRLISDGKVNIIGVKDHVLLAGENRTCTKAVIERLQPVFPCFHEADNLLHTGLENIGCIFHPCVILCNAAAIERGNSFYFYRDMTPQTSRLIKQVDNERLAVGEAYGLHLTSAEQWVSEAYSNVTGMNLCEKMQNNPAYNDILAPDTIFSRQLMEDIPTGLIPISELGAARKVPTPVTDSIITLSGALLETDFRATGRTLESMNVTEDFLLRLNK